MDWLEFWLGVLKEIAPILIAIITIIPTIRNNRKKTEESIQEVKNALDKHIKEDENEKASSKRYRILRFYDEICEGREHSESHYEDILEDIDDYELHCNKHPEFRNNRGKAAMEAIKETYQELKRTRRFLTMKKKGEKDETAKQSV